MLRCLKWLLLIRRAEGGRLKVGLKRCLLRRLLRLILWMCWARPRTSSGCGRHASRADATLLLDVGRQRWS